FLEISSSVGIFISCCIGGLFLTEFLLWFGRCICWSRSPRFGDTTEHSVFNALGVAVEKRPAAILAMSLFALGALSLGTLSINTGLNQSDQFIDTPESISAARELSDALPDASSTPAIISTENITATSERLSDAGLQPRPNDEGFIEVSGASTPELRAIL